MTFRTAILDTGSTFIVVPENEMNLIANQLNAKKTSNGYYEINCDDRNSLPSITFTIENQQFSLSGSDYVVNIADQVEHGYQSAKCILGLISGNVIFNYCRIIMV